MLTVGTDVAVFIRKHPFTMVAAMNLARRDRQPDNQLTALSFKLGMGAARRFGQSDRPRVPVLRSGCTSREDRM